MRIEARKGQALSELAVGMFAVALVASALLGFSGYIAESLDMHRTLRAKAGSSALNSTGGPMVYASASDSAEVEIEPIAAGYVFGTTRMKVEEEVFIPKMRILP